MIKIEKIVEKHLEQVLDLKVTDKQLKFVDAIQDILENILETSHKHVILVNDDVVGIFVIDTLYSDNYGFCSKGSLGLRSFFIDSRHQGKGYGKSTILVLKSYLKETYSKYDRMYLTVNCKNLLAYRFYLSNGFTDTGDLYLGGTAGAQYVMVMKTA